MSVLLKPLEWIFSLVGFLLGALQLPDSFLNLVDTAFAFIFDVIAMSSWIIPYQVLMICVTTLFIVDNFAIIVSIVKWLISFIPGVG